MKTFAWVAGTVVIGGLLAFVAGPRFYAHLSGGNSYSVPAASMQPTLLVGDTVLAAKPDQDLQYGDIVVFAHPKRPNGDFIKRVMALPGDTIAMVDGVVHLNGTALTMDQIADLEEPRDPGPWQRCTNTPVPEGQPCRIERWTETLPNGRTHRVLNLGETRMDNTPPVSVPEGFVFVMGDHRDNSVDSRFPELQLVPKDNVKYLVRMVHYSIDPATGLPRWDRFLHGMTNQ